MTLLNNFFQQLKTVVVLNIFFEIDTFFQDSWWKKVQKHCIDFKIEIEQCQKSLMSLLINLKHPYWIKVLISLKKQAPELLNCIFCRLQ